ncbi:hypothetical protein PHLCEN_2v9695 [Hermanssonia centrifuga]|uniref:N-terminal methionine N(alpha)-acetyltransferase NatE n=1 Tax=Hermanssonia centrifuga TaxID=98765 RepID=A0A2R6NQ25_9APHY|nr:hypothetical protein PHLCEN_2v9695 [Hermanssonia centrifuga]
MSSTRLPPRVSFASLTPNNLGNCQKNVHKIQTHLATGTVRKLNSVLFPIKYSEKFYNDILQPELEDFCKLVYYNDVPVGTFCCRIETSGGQMKLYVMTMGVLAPYRSRGLGSQCLDHIIRTAAAHQNPHLSAIFLHVQISNPAAKTFYERNGFKELGVFENYYKKLVPHDAWILEKEVTAGDVGEIDAA